MLVGLERAALLLAVVVVVQVALVVLQIITTLLVVQVALVLLQALRVLRFITELVAVVDPVHGEVQVDWVVAALALLAMLLAEAIMQAMAVAMEVVVAAVQLQYRKVELAQQVSLFYLLIPVIHLQLIQVLVD